MTNPFKIWTTYITAIVYTLGFFIIAKIPILAKIFYFPILLIAALFIPSNAGLESIGTAFFVFILFTPIFGFILGWMLHFILNRYLIGGN